MHHHAVACNEHAQTASKFNSHMQKLESVDTLQNKANWQRWQLITQIINNYSTAKFQSPSGILASEFIRQRMFSKWVVKIRPQPSGKSKKLTISSRFPPCSESGRGRAVAAPKRRQDSTAAMLHRYGIRIRRYGYDDTAIRHLQKIRIRRYGEYI